MSLQLPYRAFMRKASFTCQFVILLISVSVICQSGCGTVVEDRSGGEFDGVPLADTSDARSSPELSEQSFEKAFELFGRLKFKEALPHFQEAVRHDPQDADKRAWLAHNYRYLRDTKAMRDEATEAVRLQPCNSFANAVLAASYNDQFFYGVEGADSERVWELLGKAVECNPADGNAWSDLWPIAMRRGDLAMEKRVMRTMVEIGFLTPVALAYGRWMLEYLPENAILLTNGDMDTYPLVALQEVENLRTDVAVVNYSLLNTTWYARWLRDQRGVVLPFDDTALDELGPYESDFGGVILISKQIVRGWIDLQKERTLKRPLTIAVTVSDLKFYADTRHHLQLAGPYYHLLREPPAESNDLERLKDCLGNVRAKDFAGPWIVPGDRRAYVIAGGNGAVSNITAAAITYGRALRDVGRISEAREVAAFAEEFDRVTQSSDRFDEHIEHLKRSVQEAAPE